jgi:hypothetical protein
MNKIDWDKCHRSTGSGSEARFIEICVETYDLEQICLFISDWAAVERVCERSSSSSGR